MKSAVILYCAEGAEGNRSEEQVDRLATAAGAEGDQSYPIFIEADPLLEGVRSV